MKARVVPFRIELRDSQNRTMGTGRSPCVHLSEILGWMREKSEGEEWRRRREAAAHAGDAFMKMGFVWEIAIEDAMAKYIRGQREQVKAQQEIKVDDIAMTIDARIKLRKGRGMIEEYKFTFRSERVLVPAIESGIFLFEALEENFEWYLRQVMGYCYGATIYFKKAYDTARLVIFFGSGDYSHGKTPHGFPHPHCFKITFTARQLAENWMSILRNRDAMLRERKANAKRRRA